MRKRYVALYLAIGVGLLVCPQAVRADGDIRAKIEAAGDAEKWDADVVVVLDEKDVTVRANGLGVATTHQVVKVLRDGGIRSQGVQRFPFDPHTNRLELIAVRIYRQDGAVEEVAIDVPPQQPQPASGIFWPTDQYVLAVPRLAIGDAVETITKMTGFNVAYLAEDNFDNRNALGAALQPPVPGHWHDEVHFWSDVPIIEKRYTVRVPKDKPLQFEVYNGEVGTSVLFEDGHIVYSFEKKNIKPYEHEPRMESEPNALPKLLLATLPTWEDKGRWLYEVSEPQFEADDAIRAKVAEITDGLKTDEEIYTALNHWVAENIRYAGTSRGMCEGYTVHRSIETFHDRAGVCKDKAGMLVTMLRVAGYDSFLTMTMARQRVDRVPADQFNHAVTVLRWPDGSLKLLDPTWMVKSRDNWSTLEPLQHVVYGVPEGKELSQSPYFTPEECQATWRAKSSIDERNRLRGMLDFMAVGTPEGRIRRTLSGLHPADRDQFWDRTFQRLSPSARPKNVVAMEPDDFSGPLTIKCDYEAQDFALGEKNRRFFKLPMMQTVFGDRALYDLFDCTSTDERQFAIKLLATRLGHIEEVVRIPSGWTIGDLPDPVDIDGPSAGLHFEIEAKPGQLQYTCKLVVKRWQIPAEEYANFKEVVEKFEELADTVITCDLEGSHAQR